MISYIQEKQQRLAQYICRNRQSQYTYAPIEKFMLDFPQAKFQRLRITNCRQEALDCILYSEKRSDTCIIYAHGLGSNKLEAIPYIRKARMLCTYHFMLFDFSGSGRSEGKYTGYGLLEQYDIKAVLNSLEMNRRYSNYILWGRSMGAVSIILSQNLIQNKKIKLLVLDSPYCSFEKIALELASKKMMFPEIITKSLLEAIKKTFQQKMEINPFKITLQQTMLKIMVPMLFIYSRLDEVVDYQHSQILISKCCIKPFRLEINQTHNKQRNFRSIQKIIDHIQQTIKANCRRIRRQTSQSISKKLNIVSADSSCSKEYYSPTKITYKSNTKRKPIFAHQQNQTEKIQQLYQGDQYFTQITNYKTKKAVENTKQYQITEYFQFKEEYPLLREGITTKLQNMHTTPEVSSNRLTRFSNKKNLVSLKRNKLNFAQDII